MGRHDTVGLNHYSITTVKYTQWVDMTQLLATNIDNKHAHIHIFADDKRAWSLQYIHLIQCTAFHLNIHKYNPQDNIHLDILANVLWPSEWSEGN